jgi:hypothetical protein
VLWAEVVGHREMAHQQAPVVTVAPAVVEAGLTMERPLEKAPARQGHRCKDGTADLAIRRVEMPLVVAAVDTDRQGRRAYPIWAAPAAPVTGVPFPEPIQAMPAVEQGRECKVLETIRVRSRLVLAVAGLRTAREMQERTAAVAAVATATMEAVATAARAS